MDESRRNVPVTAEEWGEILTGIPAWAKGEPDAEEYVSGDSPEERAERAMTNWAQEDRTLKVASAALFALGLFSRDDVDLLSVAAMNAEDNGDVTDARGFNDLAARIEALLPLAGDPSASGRQGGEVEADPPGHSPMVEGLIREIRSEAFRESDVLKFLDEPPAGQDTEEGRAEADRWRRFAEEPIPAGEEALVWDGGHFFIAVVHGAWVDAAGGPSWRDADRDRLWWRPMPAYPEEGR